MPTFHRCAVLVLASLLVAWPGLEAGWTEIAGIPQTSQTPQAPRPPQTRRPARRAPQRPPAPMRGLQLENLTWPEAEKALSSQVVVVLPIGAAAAEHGPHLKLKNDWVMAEYFKRRILERADVVVAPTVNYHYYPALVEYPGSTSLQLDTARKLIVDICRSLSRFGPRRFYALNTAASVMNALEPAAKELADDGIIFRYTNVLTVNEAVERELRQQQSGTHADEIETSMMLHIDPSSVDMSSAVQDYGSGEGVFTRKPGGGGHYSRTGIAGDPTLATRAKGEKLAAGFEEGILADVAALSRTMLPSRTKPLTQQERTAREERLIRTELTERYVTAWNAGDAKAMGRLWSADGDVGSLATGSISRAEQVERTWADAFGRRAPGFAGLLRATVSSIRFLRPDVAVVDGTFEYLVREATGQDALAARERFTAVMTRTDGTWLIAASRVVEQQMPQAPARRRR